MDYALRDLTYTVSKSYTRDRIYRGFTRHSVKQEARFLAIAYYDGEPELWDIATVMEDSIWYPHPVAIGELKTYYKRECGRDDITITVYEREPCEYLC